MTSRLLLTLGLSWSLAGCVIYNPAPDSGFFAPLTSLEDITKASTSYLLLYSHWPENLDQLREGYSIAGIEPLVLGQISDIQIVKKSESSSIYVIKFLGGGRSTIKLNTQNSP